MPGPGRGHTLQCGPGVQGRLEAKVLTHRSPAPEQTREDSGSTRNSAGGPPQSAVGDHTCIKRSGAPLPAGGEAKRRNQGQTECCGGCHGSRRKWMGTTDRRPMRREARPTGARDSRVAGDHERRPATCVQADGDSTNVRRTNGRPLRVGRSTVRPEMTIAADPASTRDTAPYGRNRTGHGEALKPKRTRKPPQYDHWGSVDLVFVSAASSCGPWRSKSSCSSGLNLLGSVVRRKSLRISTKRTGSSTWG